MTPLPCNAVRQTGFSLLELMVSITIGIILMTGMVAMFNSSGEARRELEKTGTLIENGRFAINLLYDDVHHAGFFGQFYDLGDAPGVDPDPCFVPTNVADLAQLVTDLALPIQGFRAATISAYPSIVADTTCDDIGVLPLTNFVPGSDILVIRRADTAVFAGDPGDPDIDDENAVFLQANARNLNLMFGASGANVPATTADNDLTASLPMYPSKAVGGTADTRKFHVHVYFVAPCGYGSGVNETCTAADDDVPTLKRLELDGNGGVTTMKLVSLVEGIELMKIRYGLDTVPTAVNLTTGLIGDGMPDSYVPEPTLDQSPGVASVRIYLLARSTQATQEYRDTKQYNLDGFIVAPSGDKFRRRVYSTEVMPINMAGRREIPN